MQDTEFHRLKSADSAGAFDLDNETAAIFQGYHAKANKSLFVLDGPQHAPKGRTRAYRAERTHQRLMAWLRTQGVTDARPLHVMRKENGSIVATEHGLFAAQSGQHTDHYRSHLRRRKEACHYRLGITARRTCAGFSCKQRTAIAGSSATSLPCSPT